MIAVLIVFLVANEKNRDVMKKYQNETATGQRQDTVTVSDEISTKN